MTAEERPCFVDSDDRELFEDVPQDRLVAMLEVARGLVDRFEWQYADPDTGFWIGRSGLITVSFCEDDDGTLGDRPFLAALEVDGDNGSMVTVAVELFAFDGYADAKARAIRLLLLALGPVGSALLSHNPTAGERR